MKIFYGEKVLGGYAGLILGGGVPPGSPNSDLFQTKKYGYSHPFSDLSCKK